MPQAYRTYLWQVEDWPTWRFDLALLAGPLAEVSRAQGYLLGKVADIWLPQREQANLLMLTQDVLQTSAIEGEQLDIEAVRSSLARHLGVEIGALAPVDRNVDGVVEMILDATGQSELPLTGERLCGWHAALFPTGYSGLAKIQVGTYRNDLGGPIQVVSGPIGRQKVHFEAPPAERLESEMKRFLAWFNAPTEPLHPMLKAGLAHLWFLTLHPFEDGNGRIGRAISDMLLTRADGSSQRFYSLSAQIQRDRRAYYDILERTQQGSLDVTRWLVWFLQTLQRTIDQAHLTLDAVLAKAVFWQRLTGLPLNPRQTKVLNLLLDGFDGKLTSRKWAALTKCSPDTALRDINELIGHDVLQRSAAGGRSMSYELGLKDRW